MRPLVVLLAISITPCFARAVPPQLLLQAATFRGLDQAQQPGNEVEVLVTVPVRPLTYRQRAPHSYQASATVELTILKADGQPAWQETVTLRPPVLTDTSVSIKPPLSFLKRVPLPNGAYKLRGTVHDQFAQADGITTIEQPLLVAVPVGPAFSSVLLLSQPAAKAGAGLLSRGGYQLARAAANFYGRGTDNVFFYTELSSLPKGRPVTLHYHLAAPDGTATDAEADPIVPLAGRPTPIEGQLPMGELPNGLFTLTIEARDAATKKLLATASQTGMRSTTDYAPASAAVAR